MNITKIESSLMIKGAKFVKKPFFFEVDNSTKTKKTEKPTKCSRPKIGSVTDGKGLVELLVQQLEYENRIYFEGCEDQICVKCNVNKVDPKFYVNQSLGYCLDCATTRLNLGQSKEGVFSEAQMELMSRSMEKYMSKAKDLDENDIINALDNMDSELEYEANEINETDEANEAIQT
ncbi:MAG: hypothetical protein FWC26_09055 [Fibromonadales bacterium]|nr:hypothetical protein [Fibromonadales bacterium]